MKPFRKAATKEKELPPFLVKHINAMHTSLQRFNSWLQKKSNNYSFKKRKILLVVFCFLFITDSIIIIYKSLKQDNITSLFITPIHAMPLIKERLQKPRITITDFNKLKDHKNYLDSLQKSIVGKPADQKMYYDSKHLMDTIQFLENLYHEQQSIEK